MVSLLLEKLVLALFCLILYLPGQWSIYAVVPLMAALTAAALNSWLVRPAHQAVVLIAYIISCLYEPQLVYFLPVICFDLFAEKQAPLVILTVLPAWLHHPFFDWMALIQLLLLLLLAWYLKTKGQRLNAMRQTVTKLQDDAREEALQLEQNTRNLLEKQDYEINLATLNERNRIAREMHDHVGHLLTRAILQLGALKTLCSDAGLSKQLRVLQQTLDDSMNAIRRSLHDLHDTAIDLETELQSLVSAFSFCPVKLTCDLLVRPDQKTLFACLAIAREALSNIARHSQATRAEITVREHPGFYQMVIRDNGPVKAGSMADGPVDTDALMHGPGSGIGLQNMVDRVQSLDGVINFRRENGFVIIVSLPRKQERKTEG